MIQTLDPEPIQRGHDPMNRMAHPAYPGYMKDAM